MHSLKHLLLFLLLLSLPFASFAHGTPSDEPDPPAPTASPAVVSACARARYPSLCVRTLAASAARTPAALARDAVSASLSCARAALSTLRARLPPRSSSAEHAAARDCADQLATSVDQLSSTAAELDRLLPGTLRMQLDNAVTWASAALTNVDTCCDALRSLSGPAAGALRPRVSKVSRVTSNALYFVNSLAVAGDHHH